jgi:site-specific DNA-methyltransferase (adenine-specific)
MSEEVIDAYDEARQGFSSDRVIADPEFRARFVELCRKRGNQRSEETLCRLLMNLRKAGRLSHLKSNRTQFDDSEYRFASEIAVRHLERRSQITLDDILCDPTLVAEFDAICEDIAPGFSPLQYRWAALSLRKSRSISPEIMSHALPSTSVELIPCSELNLDSLPTDAGLYVFIAKNEEIYIGEASNLRVRLKKHLDHSDNKQLARYIWDAGLDELWVEIHTLPSECSTKIRRALEVELIRSREPTFNIIGKL